MQEELPQRRFIFSSDSLTHPTPASIPPETHEKPDTLSQTLLAAYPPPEDIHIIDRINTNFAVYLHQAFVVLLHILERGLAIQSESLRGQYTAETHPVLVARQMLMFAGSLQHANPASYQQLSELSWPPQALARRLADTATTLVTAHDKFIDTLEGLECLWLEIMYYEYNGSLRQSWLTCRRAISAAQLMGLHRRPCLTPKSIQPSGEADLQQTWLHLLHLERALCLELEMPSASLDTFTCVDSATGEDTDINKLESRHYIIASHLLERSELDPTFEDFDAAHRIHIELEEATSAMPRGWWRTPSLADATDDKHLF